MADIAKRFNKEVDIGDIVEVTFKNWRHAKKTITKTVYSQSAHTTILAKSGSDPYKKPPLMAKEIWFDKIIDYKVTEKYQYPKDDII